MPAEHDDALVLRVWDWSETSQTASVLTRVHGVIRGLAKGSRRPKAPYSGGLELLTIGQVGFIHRPSSELSLITEWDLSESFPVLHASLACHYAGLYIADLLHHLLLPRDPHPEVFDAALVALRALHAPSDVFGVLAQFQFALLSHTGYRPELGELPGANSTVAFHPRLGRFMSADQAPEGDANASSTGPAWRVRGSTLAALHAIAARIDSAGAAGLGGPAPSNIAGNTPAVSPPLEPAVERRAARLLAAYLRSLLDVHLPTALYVFPDLLPGAIPDAVRGATSESTQIPSAPSSGGAEREEP